MVYRMNSQGLKRLMILCVMWLRFVLGLLPPRTALAVTQRRFGYCP